MSHHRLIHVKGFEQCLSVPPKCLQELLSLAARLSKEFASVIFWQYPDKLSNVDGEMHAKIFKSTRCDTPQCLLRARWPAVLGQAYRPASPSSGFPRKPEVLGAAPQWSWGLGSSPAGPGRGLGLAPPPRGPIPPCPPPVT